MQYGKLISYWHCRVNTITSVTPCDCEKKLLDNHKTSDAHTAQTITNKEKTEEIVVLFEPDYDWQAADIRLHHWPVYNDPISNIYTASVFQPPRL